MGRAQLLGLEILVTAVVVRTVALEATLQSEVVDYPAGIGPRPALSGRRNEFQRIGSSVLVNMSNGTITWLVYLINVAITQASYYFVALPVIWKLAKLPTVVVFTGVTVGIVSGNILLAFLSVPILSTIIIFGKYSLFKILRLDHVPGQQFVEATEPDFFSQLLWANLG